MTQALKIALISEHASPLAGVGSVDAGGQNIYVAHVARGLADAGHSVDVLTRRDDPSLPAEVTLHRRVHVLHVDAGPPRPVAKEDLLPHMPAFAARARRLLQARGCELMHANFFMSGWAGLQLARRLDVPLVTTFHALGLVRREHQGADDRFPAERIAIERRLAHESDLVVAECPQDERDLVRLYDAPPRRIRQVPCGVDTAVFRPGDRAAARRRLGLDPHAFTVLQLGRLVPRKGVDNVIRALGLLPVDGPGGPPRLVVVGGESDTPDERRTPEIARLRAVAREAGCADRVRFVGRRDRDTLRDWYVAADVFATTPWYEPFGITPLESMACGTPVVGSAVGGIAHTVVDGVTGFLVPPHDPRTLAARLQRLRLQPTLAAEMGRRGMQRVRAHFTWEQVAAQLERLYLELVEPWRRAAAAGLVPGIAPALLPGVYAARGAAATARGSGVQP